MSVSDQGSDSEEEFPEVPDAVPIRNAIAVSNPRLQTIFVPNISVTNPSAVAEATKLYYTFLETLVDRGFTFSGRDNGGTYYQREAVSV